MCVGLPGDFHYWGNPVVWGKKRTQLGYEMQHHWQKGDYIFLQTGQPHHSLPCGESIKTPSLQRFLGSVMEAEASPSFIHSFIGHLLSPYWEPGTVLPPALNSHWHISDSTIILYSTIIFLIPLLYLDSYFCFSQPSLTASLKGLQPAVQG